MPCFKPLKGWRSKTVGPGGKRPIVFKADLGYADLPVSVPCGQCIGCRLERSRQWAIRCVHESKMHERNCYITLTYNDDNIPLDGSLVKSDYQKFMKRLRTNTGLKVRYYQCGEYGENFGRPHYHACLFGIDFGDKEKWKVVNGNIIYTSEELSALWGLGFCSLGSVSFQSAAYVARYIMKKVTGPQAADHYTKIDPATGEILSDRIPEYTTMSRRPGIGKSWYDKFKTDAYPSDEIIMNERRLRPPRYYDQQYEIEYPSDHQLMKTERVRRARKHADNNSPDRLKVREEIQQARLDMLKRTLK